MTKRKPDWVAFYSEKSVGMPWHVPTAEELEDNGLYKNRSVMHRQMAPIPFCDRCSGRGYYPVEDEPTDRYCDCLAGQMRKEVERADP